MRKSFQKQSQKYNNMYRYKSAFSELLYFIAGGP